MDLEIVNRQLSNSLHKIGHNVDSVMSTADISNPTSMLRAQFVIQQYSVFVGYQSAVLRAIKDMLSGIIQKI
ncbi:type III secretion system needle filament subunit SctF [Burkholderia ubonensis]|uniref:type III secretion system needle filament subunit SctF n=1 Tax=Burkholderia ubonensis TaxID=101571 RepID=UPI0009B38636|nr:type III secretion system needle filament subunit SctF [Burkholderia ubonensis]